MKILKWTIIILIALSFLFVAHYAIFGGKESPEGGKFGGVYTEVPKYFNDRNDLQYYRRVDGKALEEVTEAEYEATSLKENEMKYTNGRKKITQLKDGEFYKDGGTDAGSTTPIVVAKPVGQPATTTKLNLIATL